MNIDVDLGLFLDFVLMDSIRFLRLCFKSSYFLHLRPFSFVVDAFTVFGMLVNSVIER